VIEEELP